MRRILLNFASYGDRALLVIAQIILAALTGNLYFPSLTDPSLAELQTLINAYAAAFNAAASRDKNDVADKDAAKANLVNGLFRMALQCMKDADGNIQALISSGFPLSKVRSPKDPLGIATILKIEAGLNAGDLKVTIAAAVSAITYVYQYTQDPLTADSVWESVNSTSLSQLLSGLESGKKYWIRVVAYGTRNQMTVSDPILSKVVQ